MVLKILILEKHSGGKGKEGIFTNSIAKCFHRYQFGVRFSLKVKSIRNKVDGMIF